MMKLRRLIPALTVLVLCLPQIAQAHFLWIVSQSVDQAPPQVHLYFGELAEPDDPDLLDRVQSAKLWQLNAAGKKAELSSAKGEESIVAQPVLNEATVIGTSHDYGVLKRGDSSFVLRYYAKSFHKTAHEDWAKVDSSKELALDITAEKVDNLKIKLLVKWNGKPLANSELKVEDDAGNIELEGTTDENGTFSFPVPDSAMLSIRTKHVEEKKGELDGKAYDSIRHYSTIALPLK